jgi:hypothetical protein
MGRAPPIAHFCLRSVWSLRPRAAIGAAATLAASARAVEPVLKSDRRADRRGRRPERFGSGEAGVERIAGPAEVIGTENAEILIAAVEEIVNPCK